MGNERFTKNFIVSAHDTGLSRHTDDRGTAVGYDTQNNRMAGRTATPEQEEFPIPPRHCGEILNTGR